MRQRRQETVINYLGTENVARLVDAVVRLQTLCRVWKEGGVLIPYFRNLQNGQPLPLASGSLFVDMLSQEATAMCIQAVSIVRLTQRQKAILIRSTL